MPLKVVEFVYAVEIITATPNSRALKHPKIENIEESESESESSKGKPVAKKAKEK